MTLTIGLSFSQGKGLLQLYSNSWHPNQLVNGAPMLSVKSLHVTISFVFPVLHQSSIFV
jgi:hypothetical protein